MDEVTRIDLIDEMANHMLTLPKYSRHTATQVWDIAAKVVDRQEREQRERAWAADRAMVSDMERDGLL